MNKIKKFFSTALKIIIQLVIKVAVFFFYSTIIWLTGLLLIKYLGGLPFLTYIQTFFFFLWVKVIYWTQKTIEKSN